MREVGPRLGITPTCTALGLPTATYYRRIKPKPAPARRPSPPRRLAAQERTAVLEVLHQPEFVDLAPAQVHARLLDRERYLCSERTMYRILEENHEVRERRDQLRHPHYAAPELLATAPNQVWSWDITKLLGPAKWTYFYLYVILDIFSRYVVGWLLAEHENASLAKRLISETCTKEGIEDGQLTIHGDRGAPMTSKTLAQLMADLAITKSHSRPHVSDDNPFSESHFKTLKYRPDFPGRFAGLEAAHAHVRKFFDWYNGQHHHSAIAYLTPADVHCGRAGEVIAARQRVLDIAYAAHPERFRRPPHAVPLPSAVWINRPSEGTGASQVGLHSDQLVCTEEVRQ